jgi:ribosome-binding factor A
MQREIGQMLLTEVKDPRIGFVSVTRVEVTRDLSLARAFVSVMGTPEEQEASVSGLKKAAGFLRGEVGRRLGLRKSPELVFHVDEGIHESQHIQDVIRSLDKDDAHE